MNRMRILEVNGVSEALLRVARRVITSDIRRTMGF